MIPLESERWRELRAARGHAGDLPQFLARVPGADATQLRSIFLKGLLSRIIADRTVGAGSYAATAHVVALAEADRGVRPYALTLLGEIEVSGNLAEPIPADVEADYDLARQTARKWSLSTLEAPDSRDVVGFARLLQAFGALRHPRDLATGSVVRLSEGESDMMGVCPNCHKSIGVEQGSDGRRVFLMPDRPGKRPERIVPAPASPATIAELRSRGDRVLSAQGDDPGWAREETAPVLGALACASKAELLGNALLELFSPFACPSCGAVVMPMRWP